MRFDAMLDGKFIVSNEVQINIEGEIVEAADEVTSEKEESKSSSSA
jgi:hypothetical protein